MILWLWHIVRKVTQTCLTVKCNIPRINRTIKVHIKKWEVRLLIFHQINNWNQDKQLINMIQIDKAQDKHSWHLNICVFNQKKSLDKALPKQTIETKINQLWLRKTKPICQMWKRGTVWIWSHKSNQKMRVRLWERCWISLRMCLLVLVQVLHFWV